MKTVILETTPTGEVMHSITTSRETITNINTELTYNCSNTDNTQFSNIYQLFEDALKLSNDEVEFHLIIRRSLFHTGIAKLDLLNSSKIVYKNE